MVVWYGVIWCGMVWYLVVWCGVVWRGQEQGSRMYAVCGGITPNCGEINADWMRSSQAV